MRVYLRSTFDLPDQVNLKFKVIIDISDNFFYISDLSEGDLRWPEVKGDMRSPLVMLFSWNLLTDTDQYQM